ncbi:uncharacterized protein [Venturia canescens]|uniref:uncharacterized protein n=1 Tax=Venturia canescens TaxID=32260 RepID=UPI001C9C2CE1|nr:uncharacterized protein LOC122408158 [Venturia canescens]XP_043289967.1 uncharacterized protein LOC122419461 [Venturia canescens]
MKRGPYKQWLSEDGPIPESTIRSRRKLTEDQVATESPPDSVRSSENNILPSSSIEFSTVTDNIQNDIENESDQSGDFSDEEDEDLYYDVIVDNDLIEFEINEGNNDFVEIEGNLRLADMRDNGDDMRRDECNQQQQNQERLRLYNGCDITKRESELLILNFTIRHSISDLALEDLLELINCHLPNAVYSSKYMFLKQFDSQIPIKTHYICPECKSLLVFVNKVISRCEICECNYNVIDLKNSDKYFFTISLTEQLKSIVNSDLYFQFLKPSNDDSDVINGQVYQKLLQQNVISNNDISLQFNTDGVRMFKSSALSMWPIQVMINELPFAIRKEKIMLCGLWYGSEKPDMNVFLSVFTDELTKLHNDGIVRSISGLPDVNIKVHTLLSTVDSVARPLCQMIHQYNGEYGCSFCLHKGERIEVGKGYARVYPGPVGPNRTLEQHEADARQASIDAPVNGVKGLSILMFIPLFNIISSFIPDYMHCILLGVVKTLVNALFDSSNNKKKFYIGTRIKEIDDKILRIKPPCEISRVPRSIQDRALWKANEWRNFILYYFIPCFKDILPLAYLKHWLLLVSSLHLLLKKKITNNELSLATRALKKFVYLIPELYGLEYAKFNMHLLLHIPASVKKFGALWATSTFPYEKYNGTLKKLFKNTQAIPEQICKSYRRLWSTNELSSSIFSNNACPENIKKFYEKLVGYLKIKKCMSIGSDLRIFGAPKIIILTLIQQTSVERLLRVSIENKAVLYERFIFKKILYHANIYNRLNKRNNSIVRLEDGNFLDITGIVMVRQLGSVKEMPVILGRSFHIIRDPDLYIIDHDLGLRSGMFFHIVQRNNRLLAILPHKITDKCVEIKLNDHFHCLIPLVNKIEED